MALNSMGFGITITVSREHEAALKRTKKQIDDVANSQKNLSRQQARAESITLKQAAALGLLGGAALRVSSKLAAVRNGVVGAFVDIIKSGAALQTSTSLLKVFFGANAETLAGQMQVLSATSGVATTDLVTIASRLGQTGMSAEMTAKATNLVAQAFKTLPVVERTRALNSMGLAFQTVNSFNRAFNVVLTETEQKMFNAAKGTARFEVGMQALEKRFGDVANIVQRDLNFQMTRFGALFTQFKATLGGGVLDALVTPLIKINQQLAELVFNAGKMKALKSVFAGIISPFVKLLEIIAESQLIPKTAEFIIQNQGLVKLMGVSVVVVTTLGAAFLSLAGSIALAAASMLLFRASGLQDSMRHLMPDFKGMLTKKRGFPKFGGPKDFVGPKMPLDVKMLRSLPEIFKGLARGGLAFAGALMVITALAGVLAGLFKSIFGPFMATLTFYAQGFMDVANGIGQVLSTGTIAEDLLNRINESGFGPMFRILGTIASRFKALFVAFAGPFSTMGPVFTELFDVLQFAFVEISNSIMQILESLGLMEAGGDTALRDGIGFAAMGVVKILTLMIKTVSVVVLAFTTGFNLVAGAIQFVIGIFKLLLAYMGQFASSKMGAAMLALIPGIGVPGALLANQAASSGTAQEAISAGKTSGLSDIFSAFSKWGGGGVGMSPIGFGGPSAESATSSQTNVNVMVDREVVAKAVVNSASAQAQAANGVKTSGRR